MPKITFITPDGQHHALMAVSDETVLDIAHRHHLPIEGACGGALACATCHVLVAEPWLEKLPEMSEDEADMLDLAKGRRKNSRLGCQIRLTDALDGLVLKIPV